MKTDEQKKILSEFTISCWAAFIAILGCMRPMHRRLDASLSKSFLSPITLLSPLLSYLLLNMTECRPYKEQTKTSLDLHFSPDPSHILSFLLPFKLQKVLHNLIIHTLDEGSSSHCLPTAPSRRTEWLCLSPHFTQCCWPLSPSYNTHHWGLSLSCFSSSSLPLPCLLWHLILPPKGIKFFRPSVLSRPSTPLTQYPFPRKCIHAFSFNCHQCSLCVAL